MNRLFIRRGGLIALLIGICGMCAALLLVSRGPSGDVYSVAQVRASLIHHPTAWVGRVVLVRGLLAYEEDRGATQQVIIDHDALQRALITLVVRRAPGVTGRPPVTPLTLLRAGLQIGLHLAAQAPVVGPFIPVPADDGFMYRVRLLPKRPCASLAPCPEAVVLQVLP